VKSAVAILFGAALILFVVPTEAQASEADFRLANREWNGMSHFSELAQELGTPVQELPALDWKHVALDQTVFLVYPTSKLKTAELLSFLAAGGTLVVADDHGSSQELLDAIGVSRRPATDIKAVYLLNKNPHLPLALPGAGGEDPPATAEGKLALGVSFLVTNHPSYFRSRYPAIFHFGEQDQQMAVAGKYRAGRFIVIADPSIFLNNMMQYPGNERFARNLLTHLAKTTKGIHFVSHRIKQTGSAPSRKNSQSRQFSKRFNDYVSRLGDFALTGPAMKVVALCLAALVLFFFLLRMPRPRIALDGHWLSAAAQQERASTPGSALQSPRQAAAILREEVEEILTLKLNVSDPISTMDNSWLRQRLFETVGKSTAEKTERLLAGFRKIPYATMDTHPFEGTGPTERELKMLYDLSTEVLSEFDSDALPPG
jgi:hypothetical protein